MIDNSLPEAKNRLSLDEGQILPMKHSKLTIVSYGVVVISGMVFFGLTTPTKLPLPLLLLSFVVVAGMAYSSIGLVFICTPVGVWLSAAHKQMVRLLLIVLPILLIMLQSIGQLTVRDVLTLCLLFAIGMFYFDRVVRKG